MLKKKVISQRNVWKKDFLLLSTKLIEELPDPLNAKEHYQSFIRKKNTKSVKQSNIITYQPKTFENPNIIDMKSVITEHRKSLHKLSKTKRQAEKVSQVSSNSSLYSDIKKKWKSFELKKCKNTKRAHAFKGYASSCNVKVLNFFSPEIQPKDTESLIKN